MTAQQKKNWVKAFGKTVKYTNANLPGYNARSIPVWSGYYDGENKKTYRGR